MNLGGLLCIAMDFVAPPRASISPLGFRFD
jgi:hypothetical protein